MSVEHRFEQETNDWGSPLEVVELARTVMGRFDLDPASSAGFNQIVKADRIYVKEDQGLKLPWAGRVFLNPPGGSCDVDGREVHKKSKHRESCAVTGSCGLPPGKTHKHVGVTSQAKAWWQHLQQEWSCGRVLQAIFVCFDLNLLQSTQVNAVGAVPLDFQVCYPDHRLEYTRVDGTPGDSPPHASCVVYLPSMELDARDRFKQVFSALGKVVTPCS